MTVKNKYKNKYFSILGDSISTLDGYTRPDHASFYEGAIKLESEVIFVEDTWWGQVVETLGGSVLVNNSIAGSMVAKHRSCIAETYGCSQERIADLKQEQICPDVIMIFMGYNDWGCGARLRQEGDSTDISVFEVAYRKMLTRVKESYPEAEVWCFSLPVNEDRAVWYGRHVKEYCEIIKEISKEQKCRLIDLYSSVRGFETVDDYHPNARGMRTISDAVIALLCREGEK